jgi:polysaccharide export outer membrane protein
MLVNPLLPGQAVFNAMASPSADVESTEVESTEVESTEVESTEVQPSEQQQRLQDARQELITPVPTEGESLSPSETPTENRTATPPPNPAFDLYHLGPGDSIYVNVLRFPDLSFQGTIDLEGNLLVPLVGALSLQGLTVPEVRELIRTELNRFVIDPDVDVILVAQRPVQVTVLGEIAQPGLYPLPAPQLTVAIASAGGTTAFADLRKVRIRRIHTDGSIIEQDIDLFTPLQTFNTIPDIRLADGDTIIVPTLTADRVTDYDRNLVSQSTLAQPNIVIRVVNYAAVSGRGTSAAIAALTLPNGSSFTDAITAISPSPDRANLREVALVRFDPQRGRAVTQELNAREAVLGDLSQNPPLQHNDVVVIGRNFINRITHALSTFTQPFRDILGFLLFFDTLSESASDLFSPSGED